MHVELSEKTQQLVRQMFPESGHQRVTDLLENQCGSNLPFLEKSNSIDLERFRFAALKVCGGSIEKLEQQIQLAERDWRDLLIAAGFGNDIEEHQKWFRDFSRSQ